MNASLTMQKMFVRGGKNDSLWHFVLGQIAALVLAIVISTFAIQALFTYGGAGASKVGFLQILAEPKSMTFVGIFIWVHEFTHMILFRRFGAPTFGITFPPIGGIMVPGIELSPADNIKVALGGPMTGLMALPMVLVGILSNQPYWTLAGIVVAGVNLLNLFPIFPLDGGWVLKEILTLWFSKKVARRISMGIALLAVVALYLLVPEKALLVLQLIITAMLVVVDRVGEGLFVWFSKKHLQIAQPALVPITGAQVLNSVGSWGTLVIILGLTLWIGILYLPGI